MAGVLAKARDATEDPEVLMAVAGLVVRSRLIDAVLLRSDEGRPAVSAVMLDVLAAAATRSPADG